MLYNMLTTGWFYIAVVLSIYFILKRFARSLTIQRFDDKYVFITGCDTELGRALVLRLSSLGFHVFAGCLTANGQIGLEKSCSRRVVTCQLDVTKTDSIERALELVTEHLPIGKGLWAVVNNAGILGNLMTPEMLCRQDYMDTLEANLFGPMKVNKSFLPLIRRGGGRLVALTCAIGKYSKMAAPYSVSTAGLQAYHEIMRSEESVQDVHVSMIEPGTFATNVANRLAYSIQQTYDKAGEDIKIAYGPGFCEKRTKVLEDGQTRHPELGPVIDACLHAMTARFPFTHYVAGSDSCLSRFSLTSMLDALGSWSTRRTLQSLRTSYFVRR